MTSILLLITFAMIYGFAKGIRDFTDNEDLRQMSVLHRFDKEGYFGSKPYNYKRKDKKNKLLNFLFHTILVPFADVWHGCTTVSRISNAASLITIGYCKSGEYVSKLFENYLFPLDNLTFFDFLGTKSIDILFGYIVLVFILYLVNAITFHLSWYWVLRRDTNLIDYIKKMLKLDV